ncbi:MAG TPA: ABC transporter permease, partial [Bacteroidia bacterium]|nr:ABC transporter permease [Bacteroidia bacterium]
MNKKSISPSVIIWIRLKKNVPAVLGLAVILLATFISFFCYLIIPDNSPDANEMSLALSTMPPGSTITVLKIPNSNSNTQVTLLERIFSGAPSGFKSIPVDSIWFDKDTVCFIEYSGDSPINFVTEKFHVAKIYFGSDNFTIKGSVVSFGNTAGDKINRSISEMKNEIASERIAEKKFYLGTDRFGRDLLSRILAGTRVSMSVGLIAVIISLIIGVALGSIAGFFRGSIDDVIMWLINVVWSIPTLLLVIAITLA